MGCFQRTASKHVYYQGWNRSPAQAGCMRQVLGPGALGRPRGIGWRGRWEGGSGWGTHVNPWLIHFSVMQKPLQYCKVISLQLIKINRKTKKKQFKKIKDNRPNMESLMLTFLRIRSLEWDLWVWFQGPTNCGGFLSWKKVNMLVTQVCLILWNPMDCNPSGFSTHEILQARILE